jgi:N6-L-threonylcarbamoyladenine synthase
VRTILGIETSCDETSAAVLEGRVVRSSIVASQVDLHAQWGGVVPEAAARQHVERLNPILQQALDTAGVGWADIDGIAVTNRPGLVGALVVGLAAAKALAFALNRPFVGVHHLEGHLYSAFLETPDAPIPFPHLALIVSGGHTELVLARGHGDYLLLGQTLDDAVGEAFDKTARLLGLGYPGGPAIDRRARLGDPTAFRFPRAKVEGWNFSYSGLKTAVRREVERLQAESALDEATINHLCASFQQAALEPLIHHTLEAARTLRCWRRDGSGRRGGELRAAAADARGVPSGGANAVYPAAALLHRQRRDDCARRLLPPRGWAARRLRLRRLRQRAAGV